MFQYHFDSKGIVDIHEKAIHFTSDKVSSIHISYDIQIFIKLVSSSGKMRTFNTPTHCSSVIPDAFIIHYIKINSIQLTSCDISWHNLDM